MTFKETLGQALEWLQHDKRVSYRALKRQFDLDDDALEDLKKAVLYTHPRVVDDHGRGLVWTEAPLAPDPAARCGGWVWLGVLEAVTYTIALLQRDGRLTYRALKDDVGFNDALLHAVRDELIFKCLAHDEDGTGLVWSAAIAPPAPPTLSRGLYAQTSMPTAAAGQETAGLPEERPAGLPDDGMAAASSQRNAPEAERRQVTVIFCDLVDSTKVARHLGAEDYRAVVRAYQEAVVAAMQPWGGYVAQYLGDGLMLYFGWPQAHEDAAPRAVYASLAIIEAIAPLNAQLAPQYGVQVAVRVGLHTGLAVVGSVGDGARREQLAMGDTPNIASRLQELAAPDTVALSAATARLVQGMFVLEDRGTHSLKGMAEPMTVFRVVDSLETHRDDAATPRASAPFLVGRGEEIGLLRRRWEQSKEGFGQVVLLSGEAGIGKSTLVETLRASVQAEGFTHIALRCSPYHTNSALYPVIEHVQRLLQFAREDTPETKLAKLERGLETYRLAVEEAIPSLAALLSIPLPEGRYPPVAPTPQQRKQRTQDILVALLLEEGERQPVLAMWADLHWADPSTIELLGLVLDQAPTTPMLHVLTFRPTFTAPWPTRSHMTPITLNRLERRQVEALILHLAGDKALPGEVVEHIVAKTDGVPLFVEELTKMLLESRLLRADTDHYALTGPLAAVAIPATLQDSLMARLDQLHHAKDVAQLGAVLGREFAHEMLQAIAPVAAPTLQAGLAQLVEAELLYQRGRPPRATYRFKHALIRDAAYASLLKSTRQQVHQQVARVLEARFPETVETQPELVAHHYTEAGCPEPAVFYWQRAGQRALQRLANLEAISHLATGLEALATLPDTPARARRELAMQMALGPAFMATRGYAAPEVEQTYQRARELCQQVGEARQLFQVLLGLWNVYLVRGELQRAGELAEQCLALTQQIREPARLQQAHYALGNTLFHCGELTAARAQLERSIALYDPQKHRSRAVQNPGVGCFSYMAWTLWHLGYPDQALLRSHEAVRLARELSHPYSLVFALDFAAWLHQFRRERDSAHQEIQAALALAAEHDFPLWLAMGTPLEGWALVEQGQHDEGIARIQQGMAAFRATGAEVFWPNILALLSEVYGTIGQIDEGLRVVAEALTTVAANGDRICEANLHRLEGELRLQQATPDEPQAEVCFRRALDVARGQQAKSLELRAGLSLSRLWQRQGKWQAARELLTPIYNWFTEGFDTADLQEAEALLEELGR